MSDRTALLGHAAYPSDLGQGGGMAFQSGLALCEAMSGVTDRCDVPDALATDHCQKWSVL